MSSRSCCPKPRGETFKTKRPFVASKGSRKFLYAMVWRLKKYQSLCNPWVHWDQTSREWRYLFLVALQELE